MSKDFENKHIFEINNHKHFKHCWNKWYLKKAWFQFSKKQLDDERKYTERILDINHLGILFSEKNIEKRWGRRSKDLIYGYWTEEDIRLKLASELSNIEEGQVHGQVHIKGINSKYPDLFFLSFKERERSNVSSEKNIESTAIEIKYFSPWWNARNIEEAISSDLDKLLDYQKLGRHPKIDCGYFFCIDESGKVKDVIKELFKKKKYKKLPLGYGLLIPRFTLFRLEYPRFFESFERKKRTAMYLLNFIMGLLKQYKFFLSKNPKEQKYGFYFYFNETNNNPRGWLEISWPKYVEGVNKKYLAVMLKFYNPYKELLKNQNQYQWSNKMDKWIKSEKSTGEVLIYKINKNRLSNLREIEKCSKEIVNIIKRLYKKAECIEG